LRASLAMLIPFAAAMMDTCYWQSRAGASHCPYETTWQNLVFPYNLC
jgi:hypothetical protein